MKIPSFLIFLLLVLTNLNSHAIVPGGSIKGQVKDNHNKILSGAHIIIEETNYVTITDEKGIFHVKNIPFGKYDIIISHVGYKAQEIEIVINADEKWINVILEEQQNLLSEVLVSGYKNEMNGLSRLRDLEDHQIFASKKNEVVQLTKMDANLALNNTRQVFSKVAGVNVWENDGSGIQMNISTRGLSPNRSWEYNMRQNGVNIQADVVGYPDTYYTPPLEAVESIEVVRGAGSLQYGTQLGGMVNFKMKSNTGVAPISIESNQTVGSFGLFNSYNAISGKKGKFNYYGYYHHRSADGWRENSNYRINTAYAAVNYTPNNNLEIGIEFTQMNYLLHLSAGLTDSLYHVDPQKSYRARNWFEVSWNLPAIKLNYRISEKSSFGFKAFSLIANRNSIENTKGINIPEDNGYRDLRRDSYLNFGAEAKFLTSYSLLGATSTFSAGLRLYKGLTTRGQGLGTNNSKPDFSFINPSKVEYSDYDFNTYNASIYIENLFKLGDNLSIIPGIRYEGIFVKGDGYYNSNGNLFYENLKSNRKFPLLGVGLSYRLFREIELYSNFSQGYRAIHFNDIRITNPNLTVDKNLKDSKGYNYDVGFRGKEGNYLNFDINWFYLAYNNRVGIVSKGGTQFMSNISDSRSVGLESLVEFDLLKLLYPETKNGLSVFTSYAYVDAKYHKSQNESVKGKTVEFAPKHILKSGITLSNNGFSSTLTYTSISKQFSDASNVVASKTGNDGLIPAYDVLDLSSKYIYKNYNIGFGINNLADKVYFTRRASGYPGPGLIPAEPRNFYISLGFKY